MRELIIELYGKRRIFVVGNKLFTVEGAYFTLFFCVMFGCLMYGIGSGLGRETGNWVYLVGLIPLIISAFIMIFYWDIWGNRREEDYEDDWQGKLFYYYAFLKAWKGNTLSVAQVAEYKRLKKIFEIKYNMDFEYSRIVWANKLLGATLFVGAILFFYLGYWVSIGVTG